MNRKMMARWGFILMIVGMAGARGAGGAGEENLPHVVPDKDATRKKIDDLIAKFRTDKAPATLGLLEEAMELSVSYGAPAWNERDHEECTNFYVATGQSLVDAFSGKGSATPLAGPIIADLKTALARVQGSKDVEKNAWTMRFVFDKAQIACDLETDRGAGLVALGTESLGRGDFDDAVDAFSTAVALLPEMQGRNPEKIPPLWRVASIALGNAKFGQKKYQEASAAVLAGVIAVPEIAKSTLDLRGAYGNVAGYEALVSDLNSQVRRNPNDAALQFLLGYEYYFSGEKEKSMAIFDKALQLDPKHAGAKIFLEAKPVDAPVTPEMPKAVVPEVGA